MNPGWLERQFKAVEQEVRDAPDWMYDMTVPTDDGFDAWMDAYAKKRGIPLPRLFTVWDIRQAWQTAAEAERERCARVAEGYAGPVTEEIPDHVAAAIRGGGE